MFSFNFNKKRSQVDAAYRRVFNSMDGSLILQDMMEQHCVLGSTFDPNPNVQAFKEGERNVLLRILSIMDTSSKDLLNKIKEHSERNAGYYTEDTNGE